MDIKLIALDIDGTILNSDHSISKRTENVLKQAMKQGIHVVISTGRSINIIPPQIKNVEGIRYYITSNGAVVTDISENKRIYNNLIPIVTANKVFKIYEKYNIFVEAYINGRSYIDQKCLENPSLYCISDSLVEELKLYHVAVDNLFEYSNAHSDEIEKINAPIIREEVRANVLLELTSMNEIKLTSSYAICVEINSATTNKGDGLSKLCEYLKINPENVLAVGDSDNDIEMIRFAGIGVAMGNAIPQLKDKADFITLSNDEDGVAFAIEKFVF